MYSAACWGGIGRGVYGMTEKRLAELTGDDPENLTIDMPCHRVFDAGQRKVEVVGPSPSSRPRSPVSTKASGGVRQRGATGKGPGR